jgi:hypothetical protein
LQRAKSPHLCSYIPADDAGVEAATPKVLEGAELAVVAAAAGVDKDGNDNPGPDAVVVVVVDAAVLAGREKDGVAEVTPNSGELVGAAADAGVDENEDPNKGDGEGVWV